MRIKTQGTAELKFGATFKKIDNPSLPIRNRKTTTIDFDEKININVTGKVGDKVNMSLNYNTDATFDFDAKNIKLKYEDVIARGIDLTYVVDAYQDLRSQGKQFYLKTGKRNFFNLLMGNTQVAEMMEAGKSATEINA